MAQKADRIEAQKIYDGLPKEAQEKTSVDNLLANRSDKNTGTMGGNISKGIDAATSIIRGVLTGDLTGGLVGASSPYIAAQIKLHTQGNEEARLIAHTLLGATVAQAQGNSALAGGAGAITGEVAADFIWQTLHGNKPVDKLTEAEKETLSALSQLASGLVVATISSGNLADTTAAINSSKNAVENNFMASLVIEEFNRDYNGGLLLYDGDQTKALEYANSIIVARGQAALVVQSIIATPLLLSKSALVGGSLSGAINTGAQYTMNEDANINWTDVGIATGVGVITGGYGTGFWRTVGWNSVGGATSSYLKDENPLIGATSGSISSGFGYSVGKLFRDPLEKLFNPVSKQYEWIPIGFLTITKPVPRSPIPAWGGGAVNSLISEPMGKKINDSINNFIE